MENRSKLFLLIDIVAFIIIGAAFYIAINQRMLSIHSSPIQIALKSL